MTDAEHPPTRYPVTIADSALADRYALGCVYLVDDEEEVRLAYSTLIRMEGYACETFDSAAAFLTAMNADRPRFPGPCCLVSDVSMPESDGLELQAQLGDHPEIPLIFISGSSGLEEAVSGFRGGALDFLVKPVEADVLLEAVAKALAVSAERQQRIQRHAENANRLATLTQRELETARQVVHGRTNREISLTLNLAERTVKLYRQRLMEKLGTTNLAELVRLIDETDAPDR